jgi:hypothetical protein
MTDQRNAASHERCEAAHSGPAPAALDAAERAARLCQGASVANCTSERAQLLWAADTLVLLAPEIDPPIGFEMLVVERMHVGPSRSRVLDDDRVTLGSDGRRCPAKARRRGRGVTRPPN